MIPAITADGWQQSEADVKAPRERSQFSRELRREADWAFEWLEGAYTHRDPGLAQIATRR